MYGEAGKELAGGLKCFLWSLKTDLDHWAKAYGLTHYNSDEPCEFCSASRKGNWKGWHNYFGPDATWKTRSFSAVQWRQLYMPNELHFVFQLPYLSCHNLEVDELHVMHLGTTMYMLGAVLHMLCFHVLDGAPEDIMHGIWQDINDFYRKHKAQTQFSNHFQDPFFLEFEKCFLYKCLQFLFLLHSPIKKGRDAAKRAD